MTTLLLARYREVTLIGEAYFDVAHDSSRPFIIHTGKINIKVLGTSFNVRNYPQDKELENLIRNQTSELQVARGENVSELAESFYSEVHGRTIQLILPTEDYWKLIQLLEDYCTEQKLENFPAAIFHLFEQNAKLTT